MTKDVLEELIKVVKRFASAVLDTQLALKEEIEYNDMVYLRQMADELAVIKSGEIKEQLEADVPKTVSTKIENYLLIKIGWEGRITVICRGMGIIDFTTIEEIICRVGLAYAESIAKGKKIHNTRQYINAIIRNTVCDYFRNIDLIQNHPWPEEIEAVEEIPLPEDFPDITTSKIKIAIHHCIEELGTDETRIVDMHFFQGFTFAEMAKHLRKDPSTIFYNLGQIYKKMRRLLLGELEDQV